jgi:hypothetical protein
VILYQSVAPPIILSLDLAVLFPFTLVHAAIVAQFHLAAGSLRLAVCSPIITHLDLPSAGLKPATAVIPQLHLTPTG